MSGPYDVCVIGSGAGGAPVAAALAEAGYRVVVLEKGPRYARQEFLRDEIVQVQRDMFTPDVRATWPGRSSWTRPRRTAGTASAWAAPATS
jgi:choline dehydrogenase-like flavoprotein